MNFVYQFLYCGCTYESAYATISTHRTILGAYKAMKEHRLKTFNDWRKTPNEYRKDFQDTFGKDWHIIKTEILD